MCLDGRVVQQANLPEPAMLLEQVYDSIVGAGVRLVRCEGEADLELARACATFVRRGWPAYVLANDSDFLLMADVQYVPLSELSLYGGRDGEGAAGGAAGGSAAAVSAAAVVMATSLPLATTTSRTTCCPRDSSAGRRARLARNEASRRRACSPL